MSLDNTTDGASSSRRPAAAPGSPSKHPRTNTTGNAVPAPYAVVAANPAQATTAPSDDASTAPVIVTAHAGPITVVMTHDAALATPAAAPTATITAPDAPAAAPAVVPAATIVAPAAVPAQPTAAIAGFPNIVYSVEQLLHGIPEDLIRMYDGAPHPKFFIAVSGSNGAVMCTHGLIHESIGGFLNIDLTSFTLGTPPTAANGTSPTLWLAADIPNNLAQGIIDNHILSSTAITLFPLPYNMPVTGFIGVFAGFTIPNSDAGANAARNLLRTAIAANNEIAQFVQTHRDAFGPQVSAGETWEAVLASVTVHAIVLLVNGTNTVAWRLYINPPTNNRMHWGQLCCLFGKLQVMTALYGTACLQRAFRCRICPSVDHPTPLCPLPGLPPHKAKIMRNLRDNTAKISHNLWGVHMWKPRATRDTMGYHGFLPTPSAGLSALSCTFRIIPTCSAPLPAIKSSEKAEINRIN
ncbi:hypothetical protein B0H13DRAFT_2523710 [Mycena leptocephala]|nr:hypothetical protein B0H13DRAFT_2523710 [Mycena leptocephala]